MKILKQPNGLEGYIVKVEETDLDRPLELLEVQGEWVDIINRCEGVVLKGGLFHCLYLTNNEFAIEFMIPDEAWLPEELRQRIYEHLI
ncbi:hypothetical protein P9J64_15165 [Deltaproteobacteria bacterium IMCC39524]|nr:hypothetical protein [Deltaproteobacteria bacterium IMCC39524]